MDIVVSIFFINRGIIVNSDLDPFSSSLSFPRLTTEHSGNYTCVGSNSVAQDSRSSLLIVNGKILKGFDNSVTIPQHRINSLEFNFLVK